MDLQEIKDIPMLNVANSLGLSWSAKKNNPCFMGHGDKSPCLSVDCRKNLFHCFSCEAGGTNIDLVMKHQNCTLPEAIGWFKREYGRQGGSYNKRPTSMPPNRTIQKPIETKPTEPQRPQVYSDVYRFFLEMLDPKEAMEYLKKRHLSERIIEESGIRALPGGMNWSALSKQFDMKTLVGSGVCKISSSNKPYLVFWKNRLVIPYFDANGQIVTLQGRNIDDDTQPKYMFLPGTRPPVYNEKAIQQAEQTNKKIWLCEGAIDCLSCLELGAQNAISAGSVNSPAVYNYSIFDRLGKLNVVLAVDSDKAGRRFSREFLKKYLFLFGRAPQEIDWSRIRGAKDLNDALSADIEIVQEKTEEKKKHAEPESDLVRPLDEIRASGLQQYYDYWKKRVNTLKQDQETPEDEIEWQAMKDTTYKFMEDTGFPNESIEVNQFIKKMLKP